MLSIIGRPLPCTYLREVYLSMAERDALDVGQWEAVLTEPLCKRKAELRAWWSGCQAGVLEREAVCSYGSQALARELIYLPLNQTALMASSPGSRLH